MASLISAVVTMTLHAAPESDPTPNEESPEDARSREVVAHLQQSMVRAQSEVFQHVPVVQAEIQDIRWMLQETVKYQTTFGPSHAHPH